MNGRHTSGIRALLVVCAICLCVSATGLAWTALDSLELFDYLPADYYLASPNRLFCAYVRDGELVVEFGSEPGTTLQFTYRSEKHKSNSSLIFTLATRCHCTRCEGLWPHPGDIAFNCFELDEVKKYTSYTWWPWLGLAESEHAWTITTFGRDNCCNEALVAQFRTLPPYRVRRLWYGDHFEKAGLVTLSDSGVLQIHSTTSPSSPIIAVFGEVQEIEKISFESDEDYTKNDGVGEHHQASSNSYVFVNATAEPITIDREQVSTVEITEETKFETKKEYEIDVETTITLRKAFCGIKGELELSVGYKHKYEQKFEEKHEEVKGDENGLATDFEIAPYHVNTLTVLETVYNWTVPIVGVFTVTFEGGPSLTADGEIEMEFTTNRVNTFIEEQHILELDEASRDRVVVRNSVTPEMTQQSPGAGVVHLTGWRLLVFCHYMGDEAPRADWIYPRHEEFVGYYELTQVAGRSTLGPGETLAIDLDPVSCPNRTDGSPPQGIYIVLTDPQDYVYLYTFLRGED